MLKEFTDTDNGGRPVWLETDAFTFAWDNGDARVVGTQGNRNHCVSEPLDAFLELGLVEAVSPSGRPRYAINPAAVGSVVPMSDGVEVRFSSPGPNARSVKVAEYRGIGPT